MTLAAIVFGVAGMILSGGFVQDILFQLGEALIHSQSGHLQVAKSGFFTLGSRKPDQYVIAKPEEVTRAGRGAPGGRRRHAAAQLLGPAHQRS